MNLWKKSTPSLHISSNCVCLNQQCSFQGESRPLPCKGKDLPMNTTLEQEGEQLAPPWSHCSHMHSLIEQSGQLEGSPASPAVTNSIAMSFILPSHPVFSPLWSVRVHVCVCVRMCVRVNKTGHHLHQGVARPRKGGRQKQNIIYFVSVQSATFRIWESLLTKLKGTG